MNSDLIRRKILEILADEEQLTRSELVEELAKDRDFHGVEPRSLEIDLHHNHLPRLDDEQYIEYDPRNGDVTLWKEPEWLENM